MKPTVRHMMLCLFLFTLPLFAQDEKPVLTEADWGRIVPYLEKEEWAGAEKIARDLFKKFTKETEESLDAQAMRYIYLCTVAGQVGDKVITKEEGVEKANLIKGKTVVTAYCIFKAKGMFNLFSFSEENKGWSKCFSNNSATTIYMFEYYDMEDKELLKGPVYSRFEGKEMRLKAVVKEITAGGFTMPRLDVNYSNVDIYDAEP
jgi:hypothetical protein